jgi:hypothetical protein
MKRGIGDFYVKMSCSDSSHNSGRQYWSRTTTRADSPAARRRALESQITKAAAVRNTTTARLRRLTSFAILCETLAEATATGVIPLFFIKGGVAIELRLGLRARATRDIDIGLCAHPRELIPIFDAALDVGFGDFRLRRKSEIAEHGNDVYGLEVSIEYLGRPWATVDVDLGSATADAQTESVPPIALQDLGLRAARAVPCLALPEQIAQKLHALTEPAPRGRPNPRARDVLDILLLIERLDLDPTSIRVACEHIFAQRATHDWPIDAFAFPAEWNRIIEALALEVGYDTIDSTIISRRFNDFLARLNGAPGMPNYEYRFVALDFLVTDNPQSSALTPPVVQNDSNPRWQHFQELTKQGWHVHSVTEWRRSANSSPNLMVLLQREREPDAA